MTSPNADTVRAFFRSFLEQDRAAADRLVASEFVFTSPQDDHIDRATFLPPCIPKPLHGLYFELLDVVPTGGDDVLDV